jgi:hypothetical protein
MLISCMRNNKITKLEYCQYLLVSQINYTLTNYADHTQNELSHDSINRYLRADKLTPRLIYENVRDQIEISPNGYVVFDDTILDKNFSHKIELVRRQYSGNAHGIIKGIGLVTCIYVNPDTEQYWAIDYRIYDPDGDGKTKLDHVEEMLKHTVEHKRLSFRVVLMDSWYATKDLMVLINSLQKKYYCPLKTNRQVDDSGGSSPYCRVDSLSWNNQELKRGKTIKIRGFPKNCKVKLFRVVVSKDRTDWIVTNDLTQDCLEATQEACSIRWKIEQFHREIKQLTGIERNQCRKARIQRNHVACALLVWTRLAEWAKETQKTIYRVKHGLLDDYLTMQLQNPSIKMKFA